MKTSNFISAKPRAPMNASGQQLQTFNIMERDELQLHTGWDEKTLEIKYSLPGPGERATADIPKLHLQHQRGKILWQTFPSWLQLSYFPVCWPRPAQSTDGCSLQALHQALPSASITHVSLQFTLLSINIWKSSLIQIKFLQHFLQHRYVLLWKLLKCHKIQKPKALLHEENPDHP